MKDLHMPTEADHRQPDVRLQAQDANRRRALRWVIQRTVWRVGGWWGAHPEMAVEVLKELADDILAGQAAGRLLWPARKEAGYHPGDGDDRVRKVAQDVCEALR